MTFAKLQKIITDNHIPPNVRLMSDSGWEVDATEMDGVYYNKTQNEIVFTQGEIGNGYHYEGKDEWKRLNG